MPKILSKSGDSLADVYDVKGSIAGIDDLVSNDVNLVHEMGATIFSERLSARITSFATAAVAQSLQFSAGLAPFQETSRLLGISVVTTDDARISNVQVSITNPDGVNHSDIPIFYWNQGDPTGGIVVMVNDTINVLDLLIPITPANLPNLLIGLDSPSPASVISIRGVTAAFGAGTVATRVILHMAFAQLEGVSSRGLPIPGW